MFRMQTAHAQLASLAETDGEGIRVTRWTTVKATNWRKKFSQERS